MPSPGRTHSSGEAPPIAVYEYVGYVTMTDETVRPGSSLTDALSEEIVKEAAGNRTRRATCGERPRFR
jgi:hypothetical protein